MQTQVEPVESQSGRFPQAIIWIAGIALTAFCAVGIAAVMGWIPSSVGGDSDKVAIELKTKTTGASERNAAKPHPPVARKPVAAEPVAAAAPVLANCAQCGVVESVRSIENKGAGSGLGAVGGAVVGGLLGNQVGGGRGQDVMTVVGAVGGAVAGNEVEKRVKSTNRYEITVRLTDGSSRVISEASGPNWRAGDKVRLVNGAIQPNA